MDNLKYINLNDGLKMPTVGFGTWQIANEEAEKAVLNALDAGYRSIDTAMIYANEEGVGRALKGTSLAREEIFLATKVWNTDQGYDQTLRAMDQSLSKLKTDYVDLYLIHWPNPKNDKYVATWKALNRLRTEGIARSIGVCNFNIEHLENIIEQTGIIPAVNQVELQPFFQQKELRQFHEKYKIVTEAWSPLSRGTIFTNDTILELSQKYQKTPAQIILRWHFENGVVAIPKTATTQRLLENLNIFDFHLSQHDLEKINHLDSRQGRTGPDPLLADF